MQTSIRGENNAASFLTSLEALSRIYVATFQPSADHWRQYPASTAKALNVFNRFDLKPMRPLVLALALTFEPKEFDAAIKLLVSISVRLVIASRTRSGTIEQTFATAALGVTEKRLSSTAALKGALSG